MIWGSSSRGVKPKAARPTTVASRIRISDRFDSRKILTRRFVKPCSSAAALPVCSAMGRLLRRVRRGRQDYFFALAQTGQHLHVVIERPPRADRSAAGLFVSNDV